MSTPSRVRNDPFRAVGVAKKDFSHELDLLPVSHMWRQLLFAYNRAGQRHNLGFIVGIAFEHRGRRPKRPPPADRRQEQVLQVGAVLRKEAPDRATLRRTPGGRVSNTAESLAQLAKPALILILIRAVPRIEFVSREVREGGVGGKVIYLYKEVFTNLVPFVKRKSASAVKAGSFNSCLEVLKSKLNLAMQML
jgi:hypothetical protein